MSGCGYMYCKEIPSRQAAPCTQQQEQSDALHSRVSHHLMHTQPSQEPQVSYLPQRKATLSINSLKDLVKKIPLFLLLLPSMLVNDDQLGGVKNLDVRLPQWTVNTRLLPSHSFKPSQGCPEQRSASEDRKKS